MEWLERNRKSVIIAVVLVIAFAAGYFFYKSRNAEQGRLILYGNVDIRQISLAFNSNGRIEEMLKEEGDAVKAGDVLARLDTRPLELAIAQRKAAIAQQEAVGGGKAAQWFPSGRNYPGGGTGGISGGRGK